MKWIIEVKDSRDAQSNEPWSHFAAGMTTHADFAEDMDALKDYIEQHSIVEVRIFLTRE